MHTADGRPVRVDPGNAWVFRAWRWRTFERHGVAYVGRKTSVRVNGGPPKGRRVMLHRQIMGLGFGDPREVDHVDGDPFNNCRSNLRIVSRSENWSLMNARRSRECDR